MHRGVSALAGQRGIALLHDPASAASPAGRHSGRIAQLVEQLTLNQRVLGSSPSAPTKHNRLKFQANNIDHPKDRLGAFTCKQDIDRTRRAKTIDASGWPA